MPYICRAKTRGGKQPGARTQPATPMKADASERSIGYATNWTHDMAGLFYILFFWLIGNILSRLTGSIVSGNIIGMVLLFASLCLRWVKAETVRPAARFLLAGMALFFVPYGVGLMDSYRVILDNLWAVVVSGVVSTVAVLLVAGKTFQSLNRRYGAPLPPVAEPDAEIPPLPGEEPDAEDAACGATSESPEPGSENHTPDAGPSRTNSK